MNKAYSAHVLDNGLTVLLKENHSAPIVSHQIWYRVGSRNEVSGKTGISHFVEHMQFRGTKRFPGQEATREILRNGGNLNAFTGPDCTAFHETMPSDRIGLAIAMEADRMMNSVFDPDDVETERTVILSEQESCESYPNFSLITSMKKTVFPRHPYGRETIGETPDLHALTRSDIYDHYRTWYVPANAVVTVAGDFDTEVMLRRIAAAYGNIPARPAPKADIAPETPIRAPQLLEVRGNCGLTDLRIFWHVPPAKDPDIPALMLLNIILAGPDFLELTPKIKISGRTSRLFRKLISGGIAAAIGMEYTPAIDPYYLGLSALAASGVDAGEIRDAIFEEMENIAHHGVSPDEVKSARKQAKAMHACSAEDAANLAYWLGFSSMFADPDWYTDLPQRLENVRMEDISRAAGTYFRRDNCVTGVYRSKEEQA